VAPENGGEPAANALQKAFKNVGDAWIPKSGPSELSKGEHIVSPSESCSSAPLCEKNNAALPPALQGAAAGEQKIMLKDGRFHSLSWWLSSEADGVSQHYSRLIAKIGDVKDPGDLCVDVSDEVLSFSGCQVPLPCRIDVTSATTRWNRKQCAVTFTALCNDSSLGNEGASKS